MPPTVSINLCCYNSEKYLEETLQSIFAQTYTDWELVVINDGSTDLTGQIIQKHINDGRPIVYHHQKNAGLSHARNMAIELSKGRFIAFIDHDDLWMPRKLERQMPLFNDHEIGLVYSDAIYFNEAGANHRLYQSRSYYTGRCFSQLLTDYFLCMQTVIIRRQALDSLLSWFDPQFHLIEEVDLFIRMGYRWKYEMINEPLAKWRVHMSSSTWKYGSKFADEYAVMLRQLEKIIPDFAHAYGAEIRILNKRNALNKAMFLWQSSKNADARRILFPLLHTSIKACIIFGLTFFPESMIGRLLVPFKKTKIRPDTI